MDLDLIIIKLKQLSELWIYTNSIKKITVTSILFIDMTDILMVKIKNYEINSTEQRKSNSWKIDTHLNLCVNCNYSLFIEKV